MTLRRRQLRALFALPTLAGGCFGVPVPELASFPIRSDYDCNMSVLEALGTLDVAVAIDASRSTRFPAGVDVDGDGVTGVFRNSLMTDEGDSRLAAQVAAVRSLVHVTRPVHTRISIVSFSGRLKYPVHGAPTGVVVKSQAVVRADLTEDLGPLEAGLRAVLEKGSFGTTDFASGMRKALRTLEETPPISEGALRVILLMADVSDPVLPAPSERYKHKDPLMETAARRAIDQGVKVHTFGIGAAALDSPPTALMRIAGATGGRYSGVVDPLRLHCSLLRTLRRTSRHRGPLAAY